MLRRALRERDRVEGVEQVIHLAMTGPGAALGRLPAGDTGRVRVPLAQPMPIPADLAAVLANAPGTAADAPGEPVAPPVKRDPPLVLPALRRWYCDDAGRGIHEHDETPSRSSAWATTLAPATT